MKYILRTEDPSNEHSTVVKTNGLHSAIFYAKLFTKNKPLTHLRLCVDGRDVAACINGEFYMRVSDSALLTAIAELEKGGE